MGRSGDLNRVTGAGLYADSGRAEDDAVVDAEPIAVDTDSTRAFSI